MWAPFHFSEWMALDAPKVLAFLLLGYYVGHTWCYWIVPTNNSLPFSENVVYMCLGWPTSQTKIWRLNQRFVPGFVRVKSSFHIVLVWNKLGWLTNIIICETWFSFLSIQNHGIDEIFTGPSLITSEAIVNLIYQFWEHPPSLQPPARVK